MKVWITKYAASKGVFEANVQLFGDGSAQDTNRHTTYERKDWHETEEAALMRAAKLINWRLGALDRERAKVSNRLYRCSQQLLRIAHETAQLHRDTLGYTKRLKRKGKK